jgi:hypothetical protein
MTATRLPEADTCLHRWLCVKWIEQVRDGVAAHLRGHGLDSCPVCHSDTLEVNDKPVLLVLGGAAWPNPPHTGPMDKDTARPTQASRWLRWARLLICAGSGCQVRIGSSGDARR